MVSWLWKQPKSRTHYNASHVNTWAAMVRRNLSMPHRISIVTDLVDGIDPSIEIIPPSGEFVGLQTPTWCNGKPNCFRRLVMFKRDAAETFGERFVSMDLDCVIGGPLDPLFDRPDDFVMFKGTSDKRPYNGSMMLMTAGARPQVYDDFTADGAAEAGFRFTGSDQAWLAYRLGWGEKTWDDSDGVFFWGTTYTACRKRVTPKVLFFPGRLKPWDVRHFDNFTRDHYRIAEQREAA